MLVGMIFVPWASPPPCNDSALAFVGGTVTSFTNEEDEDADDDAVEDESAVGG